ncbi:hypothetical protein FPQ18DRAFT_307406 [Pyronema domesticum]|nr:hypothetical protein FPQ18DRAFT_307406 [Pyronema domesticum]
MFVALVPSSLRIVNWGNAIESIPRPRFLIKSNQLRELRMPGVVEQIVIDVKQAKKTKQYCILLNKVDELMTMVEDEFVNLPDPEVEMPPDIEGMISLRTILHLKQINARTQEAIDQTIRKHEQDKAQMQKTLDVVQKPLEIAKGQIVKLGIELNSGPLAYLEIGEATTRRLIQAYNEEVRAIKQNPNPGGNKTYLRELIPNVKVFLQFVKQVEEPRYGSSKRRTKIKIRLGLFGLGLWGVGQLI